MNDITATELTINGITYVPKGSESAPIPIGPECIIRTYGAGVHIGTIETREGKEITLTNARRLWYWKGAFTLNAVAMKGVNRRESRISQPVPRITLLDSLEIIPITEGVDLTSTEK